MSLLLYIVDYIHQEADQGCSVVTCKENFYFFTYTLCPATKTLPSTGDIQKMFCLRCLLEVVETSEALLGKSSFEIFQCAGWDSETVIDSTYSSHLEKNLISGHFSYS